MRRRTGCILFLSLLYISILPVNGVITLPFTTTYSIPSQSWFFTIEESTSNNTLLFYNWTSTISIQGRVVTEEDYQTLLGLDLTSRSAYFEILDYIEGTFDSGRVTTNDKGEIFIVYFNPNMQDAQLTLSLSMNTNTLPPWAIGLIIAIITVIFLTIVSYIAIKIRQKMLREAEEKQELTPEQRYLQ